jgi:hypothetical protein
LEGINRGKIPNYTSKASFTLSKLEQNYKKLE